MNLIQWGNENKIQMLDVPSIAISTTGISPSKGVLCGISVYNPKLPQPVEILIAGANPHDIANLTKITNITAEHYMKESVSPMLAHEQLMELLKGVDMLVSLDVDNFTMPFLRLFEPSWPPVLDVKRLHMFSAEELRPVLPKVQDPQSLCSGIVRASAPRGRPPTMEALMDKFSIQLPEDPERLKQTTRVLQLYHLWTHKLMEA